MKCLLASVFLLAVLSACEGPVGPQGAVGPQGEIGPPNNANVEAFTITLNTRDFSSSGKVESGAYSNAMITEEIVRDGAALAYSDLGTGSEAWIAMPLVVVGVTFTFSITEGKAVIWLFRPSGGPVASAFDGFRVRFVLIAPAGMSLMEGTNTEDYEAVMRSLGISSP